MTRMQREPVAPLTPASSVPGRSSHPAPWRALRAWIASPPVREPLAVFVLSRGLFLLLTYFGVILFNSQLHGPHPSFLHQLLPAWNNAPLLLGNRRWDTEWYLGIAQQGYGWKRDAGTSPAAFFPLYPLLIRAGVALTHRSYIVVALVVSNLAFLAGLGYLWRLAERETDRTVAGRTALYIAVFPTALFFFAGYTESLFLLLSVASFFHMRRRQWLLAGLFGAFASAMRVTGVLLVLPLVYEYARDRNFSPRAILSGTGLLGAALVPVGLLTFMVYLQQTVGDALAFTHSQVAWQKIFTPWLWAGLLESFRQIFVVQPWASFYQAHNVINLVLGGLFLALSYFAARQLPRAYGIYLAAFWLVTLASPAIAGGYPVPLISLSRYILTLFPVFLYMGMLGRRQAVHDAYLVLAVGMLALLTVQFVNGGWVI